MHLVIVTRELRSGTSQYPRTRLALAFSVGQGGTPTSLVHNHTGDGVFKMPLLDFKSLRISNCIHGKIKDCAYCVRGFYLGCPRCPQFLHAVSTRNGVRILQQGNDFYAVDFPRLKIMTRALSTCGVQMTIHIVSGTHWGWEHSWTDTSWIPICLFLTANANPCFQTALNSLHRCVREICCLRVPLSNTKCLLLIRLNGSLKCCSHG